MSTFTDDQLVAAAAESQVAYSKAATLNKIAELVGVDSRVPAPTMDAMWATVAAHMEDINSRPNKAQLLPMV